MLKLVSLLGLCGFLAVAWALSNNRKRFPWRTVLSGLGLQFLFGLFILKTDVGKSVFGVARQAAEKLIEVSVDGAALSSAPWRTRNCSRTSSARRTVSFSWSW